MKKKVFIIIPALMLAMASFSGCETGGTTPVTPQNQDPYTLIGQGDLLGEGSEGFGRQNLVIRGDGNWQNLISQMNTVNNVSETFTETEINFSEYIVLAVFDELKSNGGWSIDITNVDNQENQTVVTVTNLKTGDLTDVITQPYHIVKIPVSNNEIIFETDYKTGETDPDEMETVTIINELPKMYLNGNLIAGEYAVVQNQAELLAIFSQADIEQTADLRGIDFDTQTLLIGRDDYVYAAVFNYEFYTTGENQYLFKVDIFGGYTQMDYGFLYGIVVSKLPANAEVVFNIHKQNNQ